MFLFLEDTTSYQQDRKLLERSKMGRRLAHLGMLADRHLKVFASPTDPGALVSRRGLPLLYSPDHPFTPDERFSYEDRGVYTGTQLEEALTERGVTREHGKQTARALFRFANRPETVFVQHAMAFGLPHPLDYLDDLDKAADNPRGDIAIHIDIVSTGSLERLGRVAPIHRPDMFATKQEGDFIREHACRFWGPEYLPRRRMEG